MLWSKVKSIIIINRYLSCFILFMLGYLIIISCTPAPRYSTPDTHRTPRRRRYPSGNIVEMDLPPSGETFATGKTFSWKTSYYGSKFHGRNTSNGEIFDMHGMTCAHRELPFNTILRVTDPKTNQYVEVRVNDRGPFIRGRDLDLSYGAAKKIGLLEKGVHVLQVKILEMGLAH